MPSTTAPELSAALADLRSRRRQPSLSAAVAVDGELVWADAVGDAQPLSPGAPTRPDPTSAYRVASLTKPMVALAVLALAEAGELDVDRAVSTWVPDAPAPAATVAQFLAHTSGLPAEPAGPWWERAGGPSWEALVAPRTAPLFPAGTRFHYSNLGYGVLGRLLEVVSGQAWNVALDDLVLRPLGLTTTSRTPPAGAATGVAVHPTADLVHAEPVPDYRAMGAAGELWSTPSDLVRLGSALAGLTPGVLGPAGLARMVGPVAFADVVDEPWVTGYGLGVQVTNESGRRRLGHPGSVPGFTADLRWEPGTGVVVAVCGNSTTPFGGAVPLLEVALDLAGRRRPGERRPGGATPGAAAAPAGDTGAVGDPEVAELLGPWYWGPRAHWMRAGRDGLLELTTTDGKGTSLFARRGDGWVGVGGDYFHGETLRVVRGADGRVRALDVATFCFTRTPYDPDADLPGGRDPRGWHAPAR